MKSEMMTEKHPHAPLLRRVETRRRAALRLLSQLSEKKTIPHDLVHTARIDLRRLQAWFVLVGNRGSAFKLGAGVSLVSPARTLHVFEEWLTRQKAPKSDLRLVRRASRDAVRQLARDRVFETIYQTLAGLSGWEQYPDPSRQQRVWRGHLDSFKPLLAALCKNPKRKPLHVLRLGLKQLRYQLEWMTPRTGGDNDLIDRLRLAQQTLGRYEDLAAFRKIAKQLDLRSRRLVVKRWRRARKAARALPLEIGWLLIALDRLARTQPREELTPN